MGTNLLLARGIQLVTFLFAAFGHFLLNVAPPEEGGASLATGIASFLTLGVLLYISALAKTASARRYRKAWLTAAAGLLILAAAGGLVYRNALAKHSFPYPNANSPSTYVRGTELTPKAAEHWSRYPQKTVQEVVADFGGVGVRTLVWTEVSIRRASMLLVAQYLVLVVSLAATVFCLTEGVTYKRGRAPVPTVSK